MTVKVLVEAVLFSVAFIVLSAFASMLLLGSLARAVDWISRKLGRRKGDADR